MRHSSALVFKEVLFSNNNHFYNNNKKKMVKRELLWLFLEIRQWKLQQQTVCGTPQTKGKRQEQADMALIERLTLQRTAWLSASLSHFHQKSEQMSVLSYRLSH